MYLLFRPHPSSLTTPSRYQSGNPLYRSNYQANLPVIASLNRVLKRHVIRVGVRVGKNKLFMPTSNAVFPLTLGLEARQGFFMSVRPMYKQLMVNVTACTSVFYLPGNLAEAMMAFKRQSNGGMPDNFAEGLKVITRHLGYPRKNTITRIGEFSASRTKFRLDDGRGPEITVATFFRSSKYACMCRIARL